MKKLYFAYGSNLLEERLFSRIGEFKKRGSFILNNYKLVFDTGSWLTACYANIVREEGSFVEGYLYQVTEYQLYLLDKYEPLYRRYIFQNGDDEIHVYINFNEEFKVNFPPDEKYFEIIETGARNHQLNLLQKFLTKQRNVYEQSWAAKHRVRKYPKQKKSHRYSRLHK